MNNISTKVKVLGIISTCLWLTGSIILFHETNGKAISLVVAVIILVGLYSQMIKDTRENSEH